MYRYAIMAGHEIGICANDAECDNVETTPSKSLQGDYKWMDPQYKKEKLQFCCVQKSKISARGWQAWKNWFFILLTFLAGVTFWSIIFEKNDQKITRAKKNLRPKNHFCHTFLPHKNFWNPCLIFKLFCQSFVIAAPYHF